MSVWESMGAWYGFIVRGLDKFVCGVVGTKGPSACRALAKPKPCIHSPLTTWKTPETSTGYPRTSHIVLSGLVHGRCNKKKVCMKKINVRGQTGGAAIDRSAMYWSIKQRSSLT